MTAMPLTITLLGSTTLGIMLFLKFLRGDRGEPLVIAFHLILGAASLEQIAMLFRGAPNGESWPAEGLLKTAGFLFVVAMVLGFAAPVLLGRSRSSARTALWAHVGVAGTGVALFVAWAAGR
jgi:hypothetical protein